MKIQIYGASCDKCRILEENARKAVDQLGIDCEIEKITDPDEIVECGIIMTPGLAIDNDIKSAGKLLSPDQIKDFIKEEE